MEQGLSMVLPCASIFLGIFAVLFPAGMSKLDFETIGELSKHFKLLRYLAVAFAIKVLYLTILFLYCYYIMEPDLALGNALEGSSEICLGLIIGFGFFAVAKVLWDLELLSRP